MGAAWHEAVVQATDGSRICSSRKTDALDDVMSVAWDGWGKAWIPAPGFRRDEFRRNQGERWRVRSASGGP